MTLSEGRFKLQDIFNDFTCALICPIAVLPHSKKVVGSIPGYKPFGVELVHSLFLCGASGFPHHQK